MAPVYIHARGAVAGPPGADDVKRRRIGRIAGVALLVASLALAAVPPAAMAKAKPSKARGRYVLPVAPRWAKSHKLDNRHHDYPAWDLAIPKGTAVKAVTAGRVTGVTRWGGCGNGVIIKGRDGFRYTYCHGTRVTTKKRRHVRAGEKIMVSGSTGHSTGPHLHLQIRSPHGRLFCPQPLLVKWARGIPASPRSSSPRGCAYSPDLAAYRRKAPPGKRRHRYVSEEARKSRSSRAHRGKGKGSKGRDARTGEEARGGRDGGKPGKALPGKRAAGKARNARKDATGKRTRKANRRGDRRQASKRREQERRRGGRDKRRGQSRNHERARRSQRTHHRARAAERARIRAAERRERARLETLQRQAELALERRVLPVI